ncbi:MAG: acyl-CoA dehydratase activase [Desulfobacterota bacterium]|nr:acyl-CoA dehydratase activase [Thermodesulfobacteriota bacterium]
MSIPEDSAPVKLYLGIDVGSVSVNCLVIDERKRILHESPYVRHLGKVEETVTTRIRELYERFGRENFAAVAFTGNHGRQLSGRLGTLFEFEILSQVLGAIHIRPDVRTVMSMGGQETALAQINHRADGWELAYFNTNGPCASGTGSFIDQQAERLATAVFEQKKMREPGFNAAVLEDFIALGLRSQRPASVACRCTVFTKSDMIHLQNKGELLQDIIYGLHVGNARNYLSAIVSKRSLAEPILFIGGLSRNALQVRAFREHFPGLLIPSYSTSLGALGVALLALQQGRRDRPDPEKVLIQNPGPAGSVPVGPRLALEKTVFPERNEVRWKPLSGRSRGYLGLDIGSTSTKFVLMDERREIIQKRYVPTRGKPIEVTQELLRHLRAQIGDRVEILGVATTGSGRGVAGDFLNADLIMDEISAHARGAVEIDPGVDTIFEIGGQDSKYIAIANTHPLDFDMNKVCAAGTGSFLHELANKYGIDIVEEFQAVALSAPEPVKLAERCTVFMESDLVSYHQQGVSREDLMGGLCYAIVHNYLNRVVGNRKVGKRVMFLGGPSLNKAVVAAFENVLGQGLLVPRHREVLGAYGAAVSLQEMMVAEGRKESAFRGFDSAINDRMIPTEKTCRADSECQNQCKLKIYRFDGRQTVWGGECGRYEGSGRSGGRQENCFEIRHQIWQRHLEGVCTTLSREPLPEVNGRPTVGLIRALYGQQNSVLWAHFFDTLGYRLVLTPPTDERISRVGIEAMVAETCYPIKVAHGHAQALLGKTRHLFLPTLVDMATPQAAERGYYCPMVQSSSFMIRAALGIPADALWNPALNFKLDPELVALDLHRQLGRRLGRRRKQIRAAFLRALEKQEAFDQELRRRGEAYLEKLPADEPLVVVTGRPYNLYDERLNLRLGQILAKVGVQALPMDFLDVSAVQLADFSSMFWGLGARILRTAIRTRPTEAFFGLHLTNFGCGADSFVEHFYRHIMGDKPYLILELDEHSAVAGVTTRLEAFRNVLENSIRKGEAGRRLRKAH